MKKRLTFRATITVYLKERSIRATITLYPIGRPVRATITLYPIGRVRDTITVYPKGRPVRATITLYPIGKPVRATKSTCSLLAFNMHVVIGGGKGGARGLKPPLILLFFHRNVIFLHTNVS